ncbi:MAG TPA: hypothetical protein VGB61_00490, partial [Pyrinomonadaceae bacterium]
MLHLITLKKAYVPEPHNNMNFDSIVRIISGDFFSAIANFLEIIGFVLTVIVVFSVRRINNFYVFKGRVPEQTETLDKHASALSEYHRAFSESFQQIKLELKISEGTINSLRKKVDRSTRRSLDRVLELIVEYNKAGLIDPKDKDD